MRPTNRAPQFDDLMVSWLESRAGGGDVDAVIERALDRTRRITPAPRWRLPGSWLPAAWPRMVPRPSVPAPQLVVLLLLLAAALVVFAIGSQRRLPPPLGLAAPGRVVYVAAADLWSSNPDGTDAQRMTNDGRIEGFPAHSPDGTLIAFKRLPDDGVVAEWQRFGDIVVARADGTNPLVVDRMVESPSPISWSSDSRSIAYSRVVGGVDQVFVAEVGGTESITPRQITFDRLASWAPAISPDGASVAFVRGYPIIDGIWIARLDSTAERKLTSPNYAEVDDVSWSPDGETLLFTAGDAGNHSIWRISVDGGSGPVATRSAGNLSGAVWSPTGSRIAFLEQIGSTTNVRVINADGSDPRTIGQAAAGLAPRWSPDEGAHPRR